MPRRGAGDCGSPRGPGGGAFRGHGRRMTGPRRMILGILQAAEEFQTAEEIYMAVYATHPGIGIATVYRNLQLLAEMGLVQRVDTGDGKARYKLDNVENQRHRTVLVCTNCTRTSAITAQTAEAQALLGNVERMMGENHGFRTHRMVVQLFGLCERCASQ